MAASAVSAAVGADISTENSRSQSSSGPRLIVSAPEINAKVRAPPTHRTTQATWRCAMLLLSTHSCHWGRPFDWRVHEYNNNRSTTLMHTPLKRCAANAGSNLHVCTQSHSIPSSGTSQQGRSSPTNTKPQTRIVQCTHTLRTLTTERRDRGASSEGQHPLGTACPCYTHTPDNLAGWRPPRLLPLHRCSRRRSSITTSPGEKLTAGHAPPPASRVLTGGQALSTTYPSHYHTHRMTR